MGHSWSGQVWKIPPPPGFNPQTVQPVVAVPSSTLLFSFVTVFISPIFTFYCNSCNCKFAWTGTRVREFILQSITSPTAAPVRIPPGLSSLQAELTAITGQFLRLVSHNRAVFSEYYTDIIAQGVSTSASVTE